ncbi:hypothetical protein Psi02_34720 [Planotetraspora silvatica]|uniref:Uncharacterized protein n=1 Tax=Planotetraspora silvatica TaxID=234614 RepID=A0A8J3UKR0_9ACTN|nr:hypothetical protein Psi02_34720 [Planotetraspora silvatica]
MTSRTTDTGGPFPYGNGHATKGPVKHPSIVDMQVKGEAKGGSADCRSTPTPDRGTKAG